MPHRRRHFFFWEVLIDSFINEIHHSRSVWNVWLLFDQHGTPHLKSLCSFTRAEAQQMGWECPSNAMKLQPKNDVPLTDSGVPWGNRERNPRRYQHGYDVWVQLGGAAPTVLFHFHCSRELHFQVKKVNGLHTNWQIAVATVLLRTLFFYIL